MIALAYRLYVFALWPLGVFIAGLERLGLVWPAIGAIPILVAIFAVYPKYKEKMMHKKADAAIADSMMSRVGRKDGAISSSLLGLVTMTVLMMLGSYYAGWMVPYLWR